MKLFSALIPVEHPVRGETMTSIRFEIDDEYNLVGWVKEDVENLRIAGFMPAIVKAAAKSFVVGNQLKEYNLQGFTFVDDNEVTIQTPND